MIASDTVVAKLGARGITLEEVKEAVCFYGYDHARWVEDAERGRRLAVKGKTEEGKPIFAILGIEDPSDGLWHVRSAREDR